MLGISKAKIKRIYKLHNLKRQKHYDGGKPSSRKFHPTQDQIDQVQKLYDQRFGTGQIAEALKVSKHYVRTIYKLLGITKAYWTSERRLDKTRCCKRCKVIKDISEFRKSEAKNGRIFFSSYCWACAQIVRREKRAANIVEIRQYESERRDTDEHREKMRGYQNQRTKTDQAFMLRKRISRVINAALKRQGSSKKGGSILNHLPNSIQEIKVHIESSWESWMNWDNYGKYDPKTWNDDDEITWRWNIDHIIPQSFLPYDNMEHPNFKKCWSLENLRPYSAKKNALESNRR